MFIGFVGSLLTYLLIRAGYTKIYEITGGNLFVSILKLIEPETMMHQIGWILFALGIGIGWMASKLAVSKYVRKNR